MAEPGDPVLQVIVQTALEATAAAQGWMLAVQPAGLQIVATAGGEAGKLLGASVPVGSGSAGFVVASGQPLAVAPRGDDPRFAEGVAQLLGRRPSSVLTVPCTTATGVVGALELVDKAGGGTFSFDDAELVTLLADIAGAALVHRSAVVPEVPDAAQLGTELQRLADLDPSRYAAVAPAVAALLEWG
jgi:GAF domain-containing protein